MCSGEEVLVGVVWGVVGWQTMGLPHPPAEAVVVWWIAVALCSS